jgi:hypothetical protein
MLRVLSTAARRFLTSAVPAVNSMPDDRVGLRYFEEGKNHGQSSQPQSTLPADVKAAVDKIIRERNASDNPDTREAVRAILKPTPPPPSDNDRKPTLS